MNAFKVVEDFERAVAAYTGAPFVVAVNSCTNALFLCLELFKAMDQGVSSIDIPKHTYVSVPMQIMHAGMKVTFRDEDWSGMYQLKPLPVWDAARRFTSGMASQDQFICTSHHWNKILGIQQGGCILHSSPASDVFLRRARFDGREPGTAIKDDKFFFPGWHMYMSPEIAAEGLVRLMHLPSDNQDLPWDDYPDLSKIEIFQ